jgi:PAS domain S-box-containing protein
MYPNLKLSNLRISTKLLLLNLMTWAAFFLIIGVIVSSFAIVRSKLTEVANRDMGRVIANSQTTRKISKVFADIDLLSRTFYGKKDYLASEGSRLVNTVNKISESTLDPDLKKSLLALSDTLDSFLARCVMVNTALHAIDSIDRETHDELTELENLIAKLLVNLTIEGEDISFLEQLLTLVVGYRESLLQIGNLHVELGYERYFLPLEGKTSPLISSIDDLILRLRTLTASIPDAARHGQNIVTNVKKYRGAVLTFYEEMEGLGLQLADLNNSKVFSMSVMESIDDKISKATKLTINSIEKIMLSSGTVVVVLSILVIISMGFAGAYLIRSNIKNPMMAILKGLESFGKGNFDTQIELNRKDEWGTIEKAFNHMAADLQKSYTALQKAHDELEHLVEERTAKLTKTTEELKRELIVRKRTEESLRESEERLSVTLRSIGDAVIATGIEGKVVLMNPVAEQLTGWTHKEAVGKDSKEVFNIVNQETGAGVESPVARVLREGVVVGLANHTLLIARDGTRRPVDDSGAPIKDDKGNLMGVVLIFRDVTEKRKTQKALKEYSERLEEMVEARTKELKDAQDELVRKERLAALGQLTATVAHEIRNPLGTVQTSVFSIGDAIERKEMKRVDRALSLAARNIRRCDGIITELLDFTRQKELKPATMDIDVWLEDLLNEQKIPEGIECRRAITAGILVPFDSEYLRRAVINVVTNAVQALQEEESPGKELKVKTAVAGDRIEIRVVDTGPGIPEDIRDRLFEPLFSTRGFGVGLGLVIVKDIMEEHGGGIEIESEVGKGTAVVLWLPLEK